MSLLQGVEIRQSPIAGKGVFATKRFHPGDAVFSLDRPLITGLGDKDKIETACSWCFQPGAVHWSAASRNASTMSTINWCAGCRKVKYCGKVRYTLTELHHRRRRQNADDATAEVPERSLEGNT